MNIADRNEQEISLAARERIDEFSRELALAQIIWNYCANRE